MAGSSKHDRRDRITVGRRGSKAEQQRHGGGRIHAVGEGEQQGRTRHATDAGQDTQRKARKPKTPPPVVAEVPVGARRRRGRVQRVVDAIGETAEMIVGSRDADDDDDDDA